MTDEFLGKASKTLSDVYRRLESRKTAKHQIWSSEPALFREVVKKKLTK